MDDAEALYQAQIRQHSQAPVGYQSPPATYGETCSASLNNPLCGDDITLNVRLHGIHISSVDFDAECCAVCMASASMLCNQLHGMTLDEFRCQATQLLDTLNKKAGPQPLIDNLPGDLPALTTVRQFPMRIDCAALPWRAALLAVDSK